MSGRRCTVLRTDGRPCRATPLRDAEACFWHAPASAEDAIEARRLGGLRRRREKALAGVYDVIGLADVEGLRRVLEIAVLDALGLENSVARSRLLVSAVEVGARLLATGEFEARLEALERGLAHRTDSLAEGLGDGPDAPFGEGA
jgi:hypothetical protein